MGDFADMDAVKVPVLEDALDVVLTAGTRNHEHAFLRLSAYFVDSSACAARTCPRRWHARRHFGRHFARSTSGLRLRILYGVDGVHIDESRVAPSRASRGTGSRPGRGPFRAASRRARSWRGAMRRRMPSRRCPIREVPGAAGARWFARDSRSRCPMPSHRVHHRVVDVTDSPIFTATSGMPTQSPNTRCRPPRRTEGA